MERFKGVLESKVRDKFSDLWCKNLNVAKALFLCNVRVTDRRRDEGIQCVLSFLLTKYILRTGS